MLLGFLAAFLLVYLVGFFNLETGQALDQFGKGLVKWLIHFAFLIVGVIYLAAEIAALLLAHARLVPRAGSPSTAPTGSCSCSPPRPGTTSTRVPEPLTGGPARSTSTAPSTARASTGRTRSRATRTTSGSCWCSRCCPDAALSAARAPPPPAAAAGGFDRVPASRRAGDALAQRDPRPRRGRARAADPVPAPALSRARSCRSALRRAARPLRGLPAAALLRRRDPLAPADGRPLDDGALRRLRLRPAGAAPASVLRARVQQLLGLLRVRHRQDELGAALVLRRAARRGRDRRDGAVRGLPLVPVRAARRGARARAGARPPPAIRWRPGCGRWPGG